MEGGGKEAGSGEERKRGAVRKKQRCMLRCDGLLQQEQVEDGANVQTAFRQR